MLEGARVFGGKMSECLVGERSGERSGCMGTRRVSAWGRRVSAWEENGCWEGEE